MLLPGLAESAGRRGAGHVGDVGGQLLAVGVHGSPARRDLRRVAAQLGADELVGEEHVGAEQPLELAA